MISSSPQTPPTGWAALLIAIGTALVILSSGALLLLRGDSPAQTPSPTEGSSPTGPRISITATPVGDARVERQIISGATLTALPSEPTEVPRIALPTATPVPLLTLPPPTRIPPPTRTMVTPVAQPASAATASQETEPVVWTAEERNALSWLCYYEVGGMGTSRDDACLSAISTIQTRYISGILGMDVLSVLRWPGQFNVPIDTTTSNAAMSSIVEQYVNGIRGSCSGYLYFDSTPGGPSQCVIYGAVSQFLEFHNGW